jgi:hypothetical protein
VFSKIQLLGLLGSWSSRSIQLFQNPIKSLPSHDIYSVRSYIRIAYINTVNFFLDRLLKFIKIYSVIYFLYTQNQNLQIYKFCVNIFHLFLDIMNQGVLK